ncbi:hypothetical protein M422DRAFT_250402 [Sphaerobolus stellatus SS14]|uniref:Uncharacterized protein n=1 Tax=Sphaerobolus stellatus (strain SS14) TaxID=990650 RepID=A0A0C9UT06_SPHS4|nr:hypothetical protein M422DRAFT_250402 [Sphaerobolus stellatus SS14]
MSTCSHIHDTIINLEARCKVSGFAIVTRTDCTQSNDPWYYIDALEAGILEMVYKTTPDEFIANYESWAQLGIEETTADDKKARSSWVNYEQQRRDQGIELFGWPEDIPKDPAKLSMAQMKIIHQHLKNRGIGWRKMTEMEAQAEEEDAAKLASGTIKKNVCAERSDKGVKRESMLTKRKQMESEEEES